MSLQQPTRDAGDEEYQMDFLEISPECSRAVVHKDQRTQELIWKKNRDEERVKEPQETNFTKPFFKTMRRFSQDFDSRALDKEILHTKNLRIKVAKRSIIDTTKILAPFKADTCRETQSSRVKSPYVELDGGKIEPWEHSTDVDELVF